ncbi:MAG: methylated-DNA--[protein]-cysteine S-methyltransferase [Piscinibacter sp.]|nr:methylated-DNA--[protein]-cysteine S-methyltransferase [Piscinibacter sp.]
MPAASHIALFDTPIGTCGIAWNSIGVRGLRLPGSDRERTLAGLRRRHPAALEQVPPPRVQAAIDAIVALLHWTPNDLSGIPLDMDGVPVFHRRVYDVARGIPPGQTLSYGEVARRLGEPEAARAVGQALGANRFAIIVPCHRVLAAGGRAGGFSAPGGVDTKRRLLEIEQARIGNQPGLFDAR